MKAAKFLGLFFFGLFFALSLLLYASVQAADKPIEISYANMFPPTHIQSILGEEWGKEVEKRTNGKVKIVYYPGQTLLKGPKTYDGVIDGIADMGMSVLGYHRGVFPTMEAIDLPMGYPSGKVATFVINDFYEKFQPPALADKVKVMYLHAHGPGLFHSKKPIRTMEDLKGLKVRCYGFNAKEVEALGGVPVAMSQAEVYEALQKGVADATISPVEVLKGWKQAEVTKYTTDSNAVGYTSGLYVVMNKDKWNSLPKDVQDVIEQVNKEWIVKEGEAWDKSDIEGREFALSLGHEFIPLSDEEMARWKKTVKPVIDEYIKNAEAKGLPGGEYVAFIEESIKKHQNQK